MCLHVAVPSSEQILDEAPYLPDFEQSELFHVSAFTGHKLPVQLSEEPEYLTQANWGLIPHWVTDITSFRANTYNARSENIFTTKSYEKYISTQRALLWVNGFYEFQHRDNGKLKVPHFIYMPDKKPFTMGCVYSQWQDIITISIITTKANNLLHSIHNNPKNGDRMPLVIEPKQRNLWLGELPNINIQLLMNPLPDGILQAHTISKNISKRGYDTNQASIQSEVPYGLF